MKITALTENISKDEKIAPEHGLSLYIETENNKILFDMGQSSLFLNNAEKLGIDLADVDMAVLSHGHYDHGGGLPAFLEVNTKAPVYVNRHAFGDYYNGTEKYIGLDKSFSDNKRLVFTDDVCKISESLTLFSCNEREKYVDLGSFGLNKFENAEFAPDDFLHEQYLLIEEKGKRVLVSGCSHKGIINIVRWFEPDVLIGGFHFSKLPLDDTLAEYAETLNSSGITFYTCHCTGEAQYSFMKDRMDNLNYLHCGESIFV